jgi:acyl carrier protein
MTQEYLMALFEELLNLEKLQVHQSFFELGGNSLQALQLMNSINDKFDLEIALFEIFQHSSIAQLEILLSDKMSNSEIVTLDI